MASQLPPEFFTKLSKQDIRAAWTQSFRLVPCLALQARVFEDMFARMDTDCSGGISFNEWVAAIAACREEERLHKRMMVHFTRLSRCMHVCLCACMYNNEWYGL